MKSTDKEIIKKIYSSQDDLDAANDFFELWNNKDEVFENIIGEKFKSAFPKQEWNPITYKGAHNIYLWNHKSAKYKVYFQRPTQVGFVSLENKTFSKAEKEKLVNVVSKFGSANNENDIWIYCDLDTSKSSVFDDVINALKILFESEI